MEGKVGMLKEDNRKLQEEQIFLQEPYEKAKRLCEEAHEKNLWPLVKAAAGKLRQQEQAAHLSNHTYTYIYSHVTIHSLTQLTTYIPSNS